MAHIFKRGNVYQLSVPRPRINGKRQAPLVRSTGCRKKADAERVLRKYLNGELPGFFPCSKNDSPEPYLEQTPIQPTQLSTVWDEYKKWLSQNAVIKTIETKNHVWRTFLRELAPESLESVLREDIIAMRNAWIEAEKSPVTINNFMRNMRTLYTQFADPNIMAHPYTGPNPFINIRALPQPKAAKRIPSREEVNKLIAIAHKMTSDPRVDRIDWVIALGYFTGLRKKEVGAVRWEWFDWDRRVLNVHQGDGFTSKNKKDGEVPLNSTLIETLKPNAQPSGYLYRPSVPWKPGQHYRVNFNKSWESVREAAGMKWLRFHDLRHAFGSRLLMEGIELAKVSKWMRHSSVTVTADIYGHITGYDEGIDAL